MPGIAVLADEKGRSSLGRKTDYASWKQAYMRAYMRRYRQRQKMKRLRLEEALRQAGLAARLEETARLIEEARTQHKKKT